MASSIDSLPPLKDVVAQYDVTARKDLGQNFLFDLNLTSKIARAAGPLHEGTIIEIGPGPGGLTRGLLAEGAANLVVIERDSRCMPVLNDISAAYPGRLTILNDDATKIDVTRLGPAPRRIAANLPYNVGTLLLLQWLQHADNYASFTLMFQKEVVDRIKADVGSKAYGRLSVVTQWLCDVRPQFDIGPQAFHPPPKVTSTVVRLDIKPGIFQANTAKALASITQAAFGQRRKMLRSSLKSIMDPATLCTVAGVKETDRAENVPVSAYVKMAEFLCKTQGIL
jgi:16S rRNA (adenine1518-N6/adenine1519-N6)-dimethyltransferase